MRYGRTNILSRLKHAGCSVASDGNLLNYAGQIPGDARATNISLDVSIRKYEVRINVLRRIQAYHFWYGSLSMNCE